jgi:predicted transcriptional regulator
MPASSVKAEARRLVDALPDDATWDDVMYRLYVRQSIERGLEDSDAGRTVSHDEVQQLLRERFGIGSAEPE